MKNSQLESEKADLESGTKDGITSHSTVFNIPEKLQCQDKTNMYNDFSQISTRVVTKEKGGEEINHDALIDFFEGDDDFGPGPKKDTPETDAKTNFYASKPQQPIL